VRWPGMRAAQQRLHLMGVMWTVIGRDWRLDARSIVRRVLPKIHNGAIVCLHDGRQLHARPDVENTIEAVRAGGFTIDERKSLAAAAYATGATFDANGVPFEGPWPHAAANRFKSMGGKRKGVCPPEEGKFAPGSLQGSLQYSGAGWRSMMM